MQSLVNFRLPTILKCGPRYDCSGWSNCNSSCMYCTRVHRVWPQTWESNGLQRWGDVAHFCSWIGLKSDNVVSQNPILFLLFWWLPWQQYGTRIHNNSHEVGGRGWWSCKSVRKECLQHSSTAINPLQLLLYIKGFSINVKSSPCFQPYCTRTFICALINSIKIISQNNYCPYQLRLFVWWW